MLLMLHWAWLHLGNQDDLVIMGAGQARLAEANLLFEQGAKDLARAPRYMCEYHRAAKQTHAVWQGPVW